MSFAITGATGGLGRRVVESLLERGVRADEIVAGGRDAARLAELDALGVRTATVDYDQPSTIAAALAGVDSVLLVSGNEPGARVAQHAAVIDAAVAAGVSRFAYTSILRADTTTNVLAPDHVATEALIASSGLTATILRNGWYSDGYVARVRDGIRDGRIPAAAGDGTVASAPRDEFGEAAAAALLDPAAAGRVFELCGDDDWGFDDLAAIASLHAGTAVVYDALTPEARHAQLIDAGVAEALAGFLVRLETDIADGVLAGGPRDLSALLGRATTPIAQTVADGLPAGS